MAKRRKKSMVHQERCQNCGASIYPGVAHVCPAAAPAVAVAAAVAGGNSYLNNFFWKIFASLVVALILQLGGAIWWASKVQTTIENFREQLQRQQATIDEINKYFRRPTP